MKLLYWMLSATAALLAACTSVPSAGVQYYFLQDPDPVTSEYRAGAPTLVLAEPELAGFLSQSGMVLQLQDNQLQISNTHVWAENLERGIPRRLAQALEEKAGGYNVFLAGREFSPQADYIVHLRLENFQATDRGEVIATGRYQILSGSDNLIISGATFNLRETLNEEGYPHAVSQLRILLDRLAANIAGALPPV